METLERGLDKLVEDLARAADTTPSTIASKQLIIGSLGLALGLRDAVVLARELCGVREKSTDNSL